MLSRGLSTAFFSAIVAALIITVASSGPHSECVEEYRVASGDSCNTISAWSGLTASDLEALNPGLNCTNSMSSMVGDELCLRSYTPVCTHDITVQANDTCASIAATWEISEAQLLFLNDNLDSACDNLLIGQQYCVSDIECFLGNDDPCCTPEGGPDCP